MLRLLPLLLAFLGTAPILPAAESIEARRAGFQQIQAQARVNRLMEAAAEDVRVGRFADALRKAEEADALMPNQPLVLNTRGAALVELRRFDEAATYLQRASELDPQSFAPRFNLGEILSLQRKHAEAAAHFTGLQTRFGPLPILRFKIFLSHLLAGSDAPAREVLRSLRLPEDGPAWYFAHAAQFSRDGRTGDARRLVAAAEAIHGDEAQTYRRALRDNDLLK